MKYLIILLSILLFSCTIPVEEKQEKQKEPTKPLQDVVLYDGSSWNQKIVWKR